MMKTITQLNIKKSHFIKTISVILILICCIGFFTSSKEYSVSADSSLSDLQNKYDSIEKEQQKLKQELAQIANDKSQAQALANAVKTQISNTQEQIDILNYKIDLYNKTISEKELEIQKKEEEIADYHELYKKRLRAMFTVNESSNLELLLSSKSLTDFLTNAEFIKSIAEHDKKLLQQMADDKKAIEAAKEDILSNKEALIADKANVDAKQASLETQLSEKNQTVSEIAQTEAEKKAEQQKNTDILNKLNAEIEQMIKDSQVNNDYVGGEFLWPVPGYSYISSYYGWRTISGIRDFHTGIDIAGANIYGKNIVASNDGVVSYVKNLSSGYGKHLMIDHGGGTYTLYAHTSTILVSAGQTVKKGQVIARVGSTGWSTGPHLHYEIWINKQRVNPLTYFQK